MTDRSLWLHASSEKIICCWSDLVCSKKMPALDLRCSETHPNETAQRARCTWSYETLLILSRYGAGAARNRSYLQRNSSVDYGKSLTCSLPLLLTDTAKLPQKHWTAAVCTPVLVGGSESHHATRTSFILISPPPS